MNYISDSAAKKLVDVFRPIIIKAQDDQMIIMREYLEDIQNVLRKINLVINANDVRMKSIENQICKIESKLTKSRDDEIIAALELVRADILKLKPSNKENIHNDVLRNIILKETGPGENMFKTDELHLDCD